MQHIYKPQGICAYKISFELNGTKVSNVEIEGGCNGNHQGLSKLCEGAEAAEIIDRLSGIRCGFKSTSCPDQLACALKEALSK